MIEDLIKGIVGEKQAGWITMLTDKLGFSGDQAQSFVPAAFSRVADVVKDGGLDLGNLQNIVGDTISKIDLDGLAKEAGVDAAKAEGGLRELLPEVSSSLMEKAGDLGELLGDGGDDIAGKIGKLFG